MEGDRNNYYALISPGGVRIGRQLNDRARKRRSEAGSATGRDKRPIREFSNGSRQRMRWAFNALPWTMITDLGMRLAMVTLTYGSAFPTDGKQVSAHKRAFMERWRREFGDPLGVWVREWQTRGAAHFHLYIGTPIDAVIEREGHEHRWEWALENWYEVVGSQEAAHREHGVHYRPCMFEGYDVNSPQQIADYFWRESGKLIQKQVPSGYVNPGRYWGYFGPGFKPVEVEAALDRREYIEVRRPMRALRDKNAKKRVRPPRGLDGLYVLSKDGRALAGQLLPWARQEAEAHGPERLHRRRSPQGPAAGVEDRWASDDDWETEAEDAMAANIAAYEAELGAEDDYFEALIAEREQLAAAEDAAVDGQVAEYFREHETDFEKARPQNRHRGAVADWPAYARGLKSPAARRAKNSKPELQE